MPYRKIALLMLLSIFMPLSLTGCPPSDGTVTPLAATPQSPAAPVTPEPTTPESQCVDFLGYPDNTTPGQVFGIGEFKFTALGANDQFINDIASGIHGLQFDSDGIQVDLPSPASTLTLTAGSYTADPLEIIGLDSNDNTVDQTAIPADNSVHTITLTGQGIMSIVITGGGFEGVLVEICVDTK